MQLKKKLLALCAVLIALGGSCAFGAGKKAGAAAELLPHQTTDERAPVVYVVREVTGDALVKVYDALGWSPKGKTGVKISTGEPPASNYLRPALIAAVVKKVNGTIVECNTAYGGSRSSAALHKQVVKDHGFLDIAAFDLQDEDGVMTIPVNGKRLDVDYVGAHFKDYGSYLVLSHFKGHIMAGFGGAIKNLSIGFASGTNAAGSGKVYIHSGGLRTKGSFMGEQIPFLESMAEAAQGVCRAMDGGKNVAFVNVLNRLSVDCDCEGHPSEPDMHDIGILASLDPLAIDQASVDLVYAAPDSASLRARIESRQGLHVLDYAAEIGLGSRTYRLVELR